MVVLILVACGDSDGAENSVDDGTTDGVLAGITTRDAWIREAVLPEGSPTSGAEHVHDETSSSGVISAMYLTLKNDGSAPVQLTGVETDVARVVEMHQSEIQTNGLVRMQPVESVEIPAGGEVMFEPGGFHIMLIDIDRALELGDEVAVTLIFDTGDRLDMPAVPVQE